MPVPTNWHPGEIAAQQARGFEDDVWGMWEGYQEGAPDWMTLFLSQLPFLSVTTLDQHGRPWCSLVCRDGKTGFIQPTAQEHVVRMTVRAPRGVPIRECLLRLHQRFSDGESAFEENDSATGKLAFQMAAVGVMLHNRRRNKMEGVITAVERAPVDDDDDDDTFVFLVCATNTFGNCPKYINARVVLPVEEQQQSVKSAHTSQHDGQDLPPDALKAVVQTDLLYLATKYSGHDPDSFRPDPPRLGNNHRGGPTGFLRTYWDEERQRRCIVLPDWSGNRFMMSIGNMTKDPVAGIAIPVWSASAQQSGGVLHLTCSVRVLANDEAQRLMRGVRGATMLWIESWSWLQSGWPVYVGKSPAATAPEVAWSPYNPPVRLLQREQTYGDTQASETSMNVQMVDVRFWSDQLATFTFSIANTVLGAQYAAGQHIVVDCYDLLDTRVQLYSHMAQFRGGEKDLNDDGTRSWTIAHAAAPSTTDAWQFELTLRRKPRGGVTPTLFRQGQQLREMLDDGMQAPSSWNVKMRALGVDGSTVLPTTLRSGRSSLSLMYVLSGIGLTPLLPHIADLTRRGNASADVSVIVATRHDEAQITQQIIHHALTRNVAESSSPRITVRLCLLVSSNVPDDEDKGDSSVDEALWQRLPPGLQVSVTALEGVRLSADALSSDAIWPSSSSAYADVDMAVVCAAPAYAALAQKALASAGVPSDRTHVESFAF